MAHLVKNLPTIALVPSLGQGDPLEKEMATHGSILPEKPLGQIRLAGYSPGVTRVRHALATETPPLPKTHEYLETGKIRSLVYSVSYCDALLNS